MYKIINEDEGSSVPTNNVGGGHIAGVGVGPQGEPGVDNLKKAIIFSLKRVKNGQVGYVPEA